MTEPANNKGRIHAIWRDGQWHIQDEKPLPSFVYADVVIPEWISAPPKPCPECDKHIKAFGTLCAHKFKRVE